MIWLFAAIIMLPVTFVVWLILAVVVSATYGSPHYRGPVDSRPDEVWWGGTGMTSVVGALVALYGITQTGVVLGVLLAILCLIHSYYTWYCFREVAEAAQRHGLRRKY